MWGSAITAMVPSSVTISTARIVAPVISNRRDGSG